MQFDINRQIQLRERETKVSELRLELSKMKCLRGKCRSGNGRYWTDGAVFEHMKTTKKGIKKK